MASGPRILVVRFSSLGDVVLTTPLLRALHREHPSAHVTFITKAVYAPLVAGHPAVSRVETLCESDAVLDLVERLRDEPFELGLDLHGSIRSRALRVLMGGAWSGYSKPRMARRLLITLGIDVFGEGPHVAERYFEAAQPLGLQPDGLSPEVYTSMADERRAADVLPADTVVLAPGAAHATKRWPARHWESLARLLQEGGYSVAAAGIPREAGLIDCPGVIPLFDYPLGTVAALLRRARAVVANDSGLMHLASAVGTPVVALFGPTVTRFGYGPYTKRAVVLERSMECRPCSVRGSRACPLGHHRCLEDIAPLEVAGTVRDAA